MDTYNTFDNDYNKLQCMNLSLLRIIIPFLKTEFNEPANEYRINRDRYNEELSIIVNDELDELKLLFKDDSDVQLHVMSSFSSKTNLINDSDIDIGLLIDGLETKTFFNHIKYNKVIKILYSHGYSFDYIHDYKNVEHRYFSFKKIIRDVEFEIKIRDYEFSKLIFLMHQNLDNSLSYEEQTFITYGKFLCKELDKERPKNNYYIFKKIVAESAFSRVEGGFTFSFLPK